MELKISVKVEYTNVVVKMCKEHPTCDGCPFLEKHKGCYFRGKIPREWEFPKEFESEGKNNELFDRGRNCFQLRTRNNNT